MRRPARGENRLEPISRPELVWSCRSERREVMTVAVRSAPDTEPEETARRGHEIYERDIKPALAEDQHGRYVAVDVDSGCWVIADTFLGATDDLYERHPDSCDVWLLRIGYRAAFNLGGRPLRSSE